MERYWTEEIWPSWVIEQLQISIYEEEILALWLIHNSQIKGWIENKEKEKKTNTQVVEMIELRATTTIAVTTVLTWFSSNRSDYHNAELWPPGGIFEVICKVLTWIISFFPPQRLVCCVVQCSLPTWFAKYLLPIQLTAATSRSSRRSMSEETTRSSTTVTRLKVGLESAHCPPVMQKVD